VYTYLTMNVGPRAGATFLLDPTDTNRIGRGMDCDIVVTDPLSSRVHAILVREEEGWWVRDAGSRNHTYVNGQKTDEARLVEGTVIRIGSCEFAFHHSDQPPTQVTADTPNVTQTIVLDTPIDPQDTSSFALAALQDPAHAQDLLTLHQLSIKLLGCADPDEVVRVALDLLHGRTQASVVGFMWVADEGQLKPKLVIPENAAKKVTLSESLTEIVARQGRAVWVANQSAGNSSDSLQHFADALCVPLISDKTTLGAIHLYCEKKRFRQSDFDFSISVANILVVALVRARHQQLLQVDHERLVRKSGNFDELIGESEAMVTLKSRITRIARATGCVLIRGESGSGKELVARALHRSSPRADRPMLSVNCAAIPANLLESQLFGHKKGSFTGAENDHVGWFQQADSSTLFLDEVGEMTLEGQAKLLRILEGHPFLPVGGTKEISVDVRVIAATNRDLREFVADKKFREDLYYRLTVFELYIPPMRERGGDIELLVEFFLQNFREQHGRPGLNLSDEARRKLLAYQWPGNVRQLRNVIDSAVVMAEGDEILPMDLGLRDAGTGQLESLKIDFWERKLVQEARLRTSGNVPEAAKLLGIGRATLYRKIEEYGIER
jgi:two-component system response regulator HydG